MIVNTEWGGFGDNGELDFIRTKWDIKVDENSINPGRQTFEKMISGMYMGELIRQVLVDLMKDDLIFFNANREKLFERGTWFIHICTGPKQILLFKIRSSYKQYISTGYCSSTVLL